ncbi:MAG: type I restriction endonuclease [Pseudomonadota bacterium]|nr:type I restriction endonuclease [Pseudomonadota bacterium]
MSFEEKITSLSQRIPQVIDHLETEEATKTALIMPFIAALGYDIFNPREVIPEFTADLGTKKGEKVDYAIMRDDEIIMLIECKKAQTDLSTQNISQLYRYFGVTKSRIAILTNGTSYRFFSDLEEPNKMDTRPFMDLDLHDVRPQIVDEVRKLSKENFDLDRMLSSANELKYTSEITKVLSEEYESPDREFVRYFFSKTSPGGKFTATACDQYTELVKRAFRQFLNERIEARLRNAMEKEVETQEEPTEVEEATPDNGIVTTEDELNGFRIVQAIACQVVAPERVVHRDTKSYFGILLDDNNRKPICRLRFNTTQKYISFIDQDRNETRQPIEKLTDIYKYSKEILESVKTMEKQR